MTSNVWDERVAARYDAASSELFDEAVVNPTVDVLAGLAAGGRALEFAVGTGRIAIPLAPSVVSRSSASNCPGR